MATSPKKLKKSSANLGILFNNAYKQDPLLAATAAVVNQKEGDSTSKMGNFLAKLSFVSCIEKLLPNHSSTNVSKRGTFIESQIAAKRRTVIHEIDRGTFKEEHEVDFNSPRTIKAAEKLKITYEDCIVLYF